MIIQTLFVIVNLINYSTQTFVDLGHELSNDIPLFPSPDFLENKFTLTALLNETVPQGYWLAYNKFSSIEHASTHVDAPFHLNEEGKTLEQIPLEDLIAPGVVIDVTAKVAENENYLISAEDVENWVSENGVFPNNSIILGRTGWSKRWGNPLAYQGHLTDPMKLKYPAFGVDSIQRVFDFQKTHKIRVVGFGLDSLSVDNSPGQENEAHQLITGQNLYIIENMNNLEALPLRGSKIFVMPMKIVGGTGSPTRVIAEVPSTEEVPASVGYTKSSSSSSVIKEAIPLKTRKKIPTADESQYSSYSNYHFRK